MAKDKAVEKEREAEKLRRTIIRKAKRREHRKEVNKSRPCPCCGRYKHDDFDEFW